MADSRGDVYELPYAEDDHDDDDQCFGGKVQSNGRLSSRHPASLPVSQLWRLYVDFIEAFEAKTTSWRAGLHC